MTAGINPKNITDDGNNNVYSQELNLIHIWIIRFELIDWENEWFVLWSVESMITWIVNTTIVLAHDDQTMKDQSV